MTDLEKAHKTIQFLKDAVVSSKGKISELTEETKELREEIKFMAKMKSCPTLLDMQQRILKLENTIKEHEDYERNNLLKEPKDATG